MYNNIMATDITDSNFDQEVLNVDSLVFVECYAEWCGPCKVLKPRLLELERNEGFKLGFLDVDQNPELTKRLKVASIPKVVVFRNGEEVTSVSGVRSKEDYQEIIDSF